jgi:hypothetical protein
VADGAEHAERSEPVDHVSGKHHQQRAVALYKQVLKPCGRGSIPILIGSSFWCESFRNDALW